MNNLNKVLEMTNISKSFPGVQALSNVNLDLFEGEVLGLVGGNGAGKSTLMNILGGIEHMDSGIIKIFDKECYISDPLDSYELGIHFIHQELALFPPLTIAENIFINNFLEKKLISLIKSSNINIEAQKAIDKLGIQLDPKIKVENLEVGKRQIVEILRAISTNSRIIIFDEPTSSISLNEKQKLFEIIDNLKAGHVSIIFISHIFEEVFDICDRILVLKDGKNAGQRLVSETNNSEIIEMMTGATIEDYFPKRESKMGDVILECKDISKKGVFKNINLNIKSGEIVGLWGLLGSGRTELASAIYGLTKVDKGQIIFNFKSTKKFSKKIAFIPEDRREESLFLKLPVKNNIVISSLNLILNKTKFFISGKKEIESCKKLVSELEIIAGLEQIMETLSGGNQQKVVLARWLLSNAMLFILDDPTRGVDIKSKREINFMINQLTKNGVGILLISSEIEEIIGLSDRVYVIKNGNLVKEFSRDEVNKKVLIEASA